ncbi:DUF4255 domain-containing protein [Terriglobus roseus]|uniref:IPT/TIG domain-containing protein n=1 Tax=Terriglobus roseus TaxID=392734 RepID=A0A1H4IZQ0_9BACT|nr:Pvc16 family protein [Terriglobus roseus]SEB38848.1 IPT/TIG domain-containing protein [Terriglobus roseus]
MNGYLAISGVSAVLRSLLLSALTDGGPGTLLTSPTSISANPPDLIPTGPDEQPRINLFMYYASLNTGYRNAELPSRDVSGGLLTNPPLALNLHYLVSAYGATQYDPEILLGWAMEVFHNNPMISRDTISDALAALGAATEEAKLVSKTSLASQFEQLKITPEALSNEEISRLWMAFSTHYRPTTSYQVSVVLIRDTQPVRSNLPVQKRNLAVLPADIPTIDAIAPATAFTGDTLTITGRNFLGDTPADTAVSFAGATPTSPSTVQATTVRVVLPTSVRAGAVPVRIVRSVQFGTAADPHRAFESGSAVFMLAPTLTDVSPITPASVITVAKGTNLTVNVQPAVGRGQRVRLFAGSLSLEIPARPPTAPESATALVFPIPATWGPFKSPLRVEVDGAQSLLVVDGTPGSPTLGQFFPQLKVTA